MYLNTNSWYGYKTSGNQQQIELLHAYVYLCDGILPSLSVSESVVSVSVSNLSTSSSSSCSETSESSVSLSTKYVVSGGFLLLSPIEFYLNNFFQINSTHVITPQTNNASVGNAVTTCNFLMKGLHSKHQCFLYFRK